MIDFPFGWGRRTSTAPAVADEALDLQFPASIAKQFPQSFDPAWRAAERALAAAAAADLMPLARRSPALTGYDWTSYIRCSVVRMLHALDVMTRAGIGAGRVLDYGSYFGNMSLLCRSMGFDVTAVDAYAEYGAALSGVTKALRDDGVAVVDFGDVGSQLGGLPAGSFDAVIAMGVIEHVPHTPRMMLQALDRVLRPGGVLVLDTPNLAYLYTREKLARGESVFSAIEQQFFTEVPFEGHHREYTVAELQWMLGAIGHTVREIRTFNYSLYALGTITGGDVERYRVMERDPSMREVILSASAKPSA